jgi:hypothetical protein
MELANRPKSLDPNNSPIPILENLKLNLNNPSFFQDYLIILQLKRKRNEKSDEEDVNIIYEESLITRTTLLRNFKYEF